MVNGDKSVSLSETLFAALMRLLPREFRVRFSGQMLSVFRDQQRDAQGLSGIGRLRFLGETLSGLVATAAREHAAIFAQDASYGLRMMSKDLGFSIVAIIILAMAIGGATAAFSAANAILLKPLPFEDGSRLVQLKQLQPGVGVDNMTFSVQEIEDYRSRNRTLQSLVEYHHMMFSLLGGREPERVDTAVVSANFFRVLGVTPLYGRTFMDEDDRPSARPVLILSYEFWKRSFDGDRNVVGRSYMMNDKQHVVVGVLPPMPQFPHAVDVYMPTAACPTRSGKDFISNRTARMMSAFAVLKPGVTLKQASDDLRGIAKQLRSAYPEAYPGSKGYDIATVPVHEELTRDIRPVLTALGVAALLLLLLACSNVAGLMLSRALSRSRELTVRAVLGASQGRIIRTLATEGLLFGVIGGVVGLLLALWSVEVLVPFASRFTTLSTELHVGPAAVACCVALSIICGCVVGMVPAIGLKHTVLCTTMSEGSNIPVRINSRARGILVAAQLAMSVILLVAAGLTLRTLLHLEHLDPGFRPSGITIARVYLLKEDVHSFYNALLERARKLDDVESVALSSTFPLSSRGDEAEFVLDPAEPRGDDAPTARVASGRAVTPGYFQLLGMPLLRGRDFTMQDDEQHPLVVIVNQHLANHYWPDGSALGKKIRFSKKDEGTIVGVVGDVRQRGLDKEPIDEAYCSFPQTGYHFMTLLLRSSRTASSLDPEISWIVHDLQSDAVVTDVETLSEVRQDSLAPRRNTALLFSIFAVLALAITASGISGLMSLEVSERRQEIGVRMALGATPSRVMRAMMQPTLVIIAGGLGCGLGAAWLMSSPMTKLIYGIVPRDSVTFMAAPALLVLIAVVSSVLPLTRIGKFDPTVLLRAE